MNKADYIAFFGFTVRSFIFIWKWKDKKKDRFEEEISNLRNAVEFTIRKQGK